MADVLDKIIVPHQKSKGDIFKKHKKEKEEKKEKKYTTEHKHTVHEYEKKEIFHKGEFGHSSRKEVVIRFSINPKWVERSIFIFIILILSYFAFFKSVDLNMGFLKFSEDVDIIETDTAPTAAVVNDSNDTEKETSEIIEVEEEVTYSETIKFSIDDITGSKIGDESFKVKSFKYTIENDKSIGIGVKLLYYAYGGGIAHKENKAIDTVTYGIMTSGQKITEIEDTSKKGIIFPSRTGAKMKFELVYIKTGEIYKNITKII